MAFLKRSKDPFKAIQACLQKRDYKGALVWFDPLLKKDAKNTQIRLRYADTLVLAGSKREAIRQYRIVADELAEAGFMIRAIAISKKIVQLDPTQSDVHQKLAQMNEERSKGTAAAAIPLQAAPVSEDAHVEASTPEVLEAPVEGSAPEVLEAPAEETVPEVLEAPVEESVPEVLEAPGVEEPIPDVLEVPQVEEATPEVVEAPQMEEATPDVVEVQEEPASVPDFFDTPGEEEVAPSEEDSSVSFDETPAAETAEPTLTLEESMEMEFGETGRADAAEEVSEAVDSEQVGEVQEDVEFTIDEVEISEGEDQSAPAIEFDTPVEPEPTETAESVGFEVPEGGEPAFAEEPLAFEEDKAAPIAGEDESVVAPEAEVSLPSEEDAQIDIGEEFPLQPSADLDVGAEAESHDLFDESPEKVEESLEVAAEDAAAGAAIDVAESEPDLFEQPDTEMFEVEPEGILAGIDTEPEAAANGESPLVGLLGDDIDSLVDSIIDDVVTSGSGQTQAPAAPAATRIPLFSDLTAVEFVDVAIMLVRRAEKAGTMIVREGDPGDSMFIVSTGEVEATRGDGDEKVTLATLSDGDFFGEMAVLTGEPRTATVTTVKNTELLELSRNDLNTICSRHPEVEAKLRLAADERRMKSPG
jgi:hypothetical protein